MYDEALVGMSDPAGVRALRRDLVEFEAKLPKTAKGHLKLTYEQAVGLQGLQFSYQTATTLALVDCEKHVVTHHSRPGHYLKSAPLAAMSCGASDV